MFNFWAELERFIQMSCNYTESEKETLYFEALNGKIKLCYKMAQYIYDDWKDWTKRESDFVEHFDKIEDYNRLLREENQRLRSGVRDE